MILRSSIWAKRSQKVSVSAETPQRRFVFGVNRLSTEMFTLNVILETASGVRRDLREAAKWYQKAAIAGDPVASYNLGRCLAAGFGVRRNQKQAISWFRKASKGGIRKAARALANEGESGNE